MYFYIRDGQQTIPRFQRPVPCEKESLWADLWAWKAKITPVTCRLSRSHNSGGHEVDETKNTQNEALGNIRGGFPQGPGSRVVRGNDHGITPKFYSANIIATLWLHLSANFTWIQHTSLSRTRCQKIKVGTLTLSWNRRVVLQICFIVGTHPTTPCRARCRLHNLLIRNGEYEALGNSCEDCAGEISRLRIWRFVSYWASQSSSTGAPIASRWIA